MNNSQPSPLAAVAVAKLRLPHPYLTTYYAVPSKRAIGDSQFLQVHLEQLEHQLKSAESLSESLHNEDILYTAPKFPDEPLPPASNNSAWARARRAPYSKISWQSSSTPTQGQIWLIVYLILTQFPETESFRLSLDGNQNDSVAHGLKRSSLAVDHPQPDIGREEQHSTEGSNELLILRSTFWQGAASPFGFRSAWIPKSGGQSNVSTIDYAMTTKFPSTRVHAWHPRRAPKPTPGAAIYSRYIPSLDEHFSMVALDYKNPDHLDLFHTWQNDPRVAKGWNETGTLDEHLTYLRNLHEDPHVLTVLARFEDTFFAYFELYWAAEDHLGAHYTPHPYDRGRHALVGNERYRGRHRVVAHWSAVMHYIFLDDPRTMRIVGEPKLTNSSVLAYDLMHGFSIEKHVDLGHKRSALMVCGRERFFQLCPLDHEGGRVGGTGIGLPAKL